MNFSGKLTAAHAKREPLRNAYVRGGSQKSSSHMVIFIIQTLTIQLGFAGDNIIEKLTMARAKSSVTGAIGIAIISRRMGH